MTPRSRSEPSCADRYLLQEPIGRGGMGVVWRAHDELLDRQVAVKCARPDDDRAVARLTNEARNAARLHHPHIVSVFDFVDEAEICWIVMEYVAGGSLADMVRGRVVLPPEEAASTGCQIAAALAKSHAEGVVHGDVTPENVLITEDGVAKLTDFGISRALWSEATMTQTGGLRGKPPYLPPEVARGEVADRKSDVFSLGATLYAAIEGRSPYGESSHPMAYVARAIEGYIETPHHTGPLVDALTKLLALEPKRRPAADQAVRLLRRVAPPSPRIEDLGDLEDPHDGDTLDRTPFTMRLVPPSVRGSWRRPSRGVVITATALGIAAVLVAWATLFGPWGDGRSDESGGSGKDGGRGASGTADSAARTGPAGTIGDARTADPCTLLNPASLSRFGETVLDPDYGEIDRCDVLLQGESGDDIADVQINFSADPPEQGGDVPTRRVGNVTVGAYQRDGDECLRNIASADRKQIWIITERLGTPAPDPCQLGDAATDYVVSVLDRGQVPRRSGQPVASSLLRGHACGLLIGRAPAARRPATGRPAAGGRPLPAVHGSLARGVTAPVPGTAYALALTGGMTLGPGDGRELLFGRNRPEVHICVGEDDPQVSRCQGRLTHRHGRWWVANNGRLPLRFPSRLLFTGEDPLPLGTGYTPLFVRGSRDREHLLEVFVSGPETERPVALPGDVTRPPGYGCSPTRRSSRSSSSASAICSTSPGHSPSPGGRRPPSSRSCAPVRAGARSAWSTWSTGSVRCCPGTETPG
ncbi:serine/threonine-protein kinase [Streptomyces asiaticus]|uniref:serine/threonine-protein kinase n=1 Tax=Streptomyces asiaticus TaxID=114695 RepID=UPI0037FEA1F8